MSSLPVSSYSDLLHILLQVIVYSHKFLVLVICTESLSLSVFHTDSGFSGVCEQETHNSSIGQFSIDSDVALSITRNVLAPYLDDLGM